MATPRHILVVSPHPDDAELGMGWGHHQVQAEGLAVGVLDLTDGEPTPFGSPEIRRQETAAATKFWASIGEKTSGCPTAAWSRRWRRGRNWPPCSAARGRAGSSPLIGSTPIPTTWRPRR